MSSTTKPFEEKMNASVNHLVHELASIRAGRANPANLEDNTVEPDVADLTPDGGDHRATLPVTAPARAVAAACSIRLVAAPRHR